jgi:hypothetical protein
MSTLTRNALSLRTRRGMSLGEPLRIASTAGYVLLIAFDRHKIRDCKSKQRIWERMKVFEEFVSLFECSSSEMG